MPFEEGPERNSTAIWSDFCAVSPSPELKQRMRAALAGVRTRSGGRSPMHCRSRRGPAGWASTMGLSYHQTGSPLVRLSQL